MDEEKIILTATEAAAICEHYCRFPQKCDEELQSEICKNCPLTTAAERENKKTWTD